MADIKSYQPESKSVGSGQVLQCPYGYEKARIVVREMAEQLALDLVDKGLVTDQLVLTVGYDIENLRGGGGSYQGEVATDRYGRAVPKHAHGTANLEAYTASSKRIVSAALELFDRIIDRGLLVRRFYLTAARVTEEASAPDRSAFEQLDLFTDYAAKEKRDSREARSVRGRSGCSRRCWTLKGGLERTRS